MNKLIHNKYLISGKIHNSLNKYMNKSINHYIYTNTQIH